MARKKKNKTKASLSSWEDFQEKIDQVVPKRELILWSAVLTVFLLLGFSQWVIPSYQAKKKLNQKIQQTQAQLASQKKMVAQHQELKSKSMKPEMRAAQEKVQNFFKNNAQSSDELLSELMTQLTAVQSGKMALLKRFTVEEEIEKNGYRQIYFKMNLMGDYHDIAKFMKKLKTWSFLIGTKAVQMQPSGETATPRVEMVTENVLYVFAKNAPTKKVIAKAQKSPLHASQSNSLQRKTFPNKPLVKAPKRQRATSPFSSKSNQTTTWSIFDLKLTGVISGARHPTALINGQVFELGQQVGEYQIVEIKPNAVMLKNGEVTHQLKMETLQAKGVEVTTHREKSQFDGDVESMPPSRVQKSLADNSQTEKLEESEEEEFVEEFEEETNVAQGEEEFREDEEKWEEISDTSDEESYPEELAIGSEAWEENY